MGEWQPIETAPKDGTLIVLAGGELQRPIFAWWTSRNYWATDSKGPYEPLRYVAEVWMPAPTPPGTAMADELVSKSQMKRIAIQKGNALPPRKICEHGSQETKCLICENAVLEDEIERLTLDWVREQGERTSAEHARDLALLEIERLRAEVATSGSRYADSESRLAECDAALQTVQAELAALRKRVEEAPREEVWETD